MPAAAWLPAHAKQAADIDLAAVDPVDAYVAVRRNVHFQIGFQGNLLPLAARAL